MSNSRSRPTAKQRKEDARRKALEKEKIDTLQRMDQVDREIIGLQQELHMREKIKDQLIGRLRFVQEQLGEVEPMAMPPTHEEPPVEEQE